jgi:hypothetical protein
MENKKIKFYNVREIGVWLCEHNRTWQSEMDGRKSLYNCIDCGSQFTEDEYKIKRSKNYEKKYSN